MANTDLNPQKGLQGTSPVYDMGTTPNTRTAVSQKVRILTPAYGTSSALFQMGVLYNFAPSQSRNIEEVRSIGFGDIVAELVPGNTDHPMANVERALLYLSNIWQATGDLEAMKKRLPALDKGLMYYFDDPTRWDAKHGAVKRPFTIDTWDFTFGYWDRNRRIEPNTPMGIMHGDKCFILRAKYRIFIVYFSLNPSEEFLPIFIFWS